MNPNLLLATLFLAFHSSNPTLTQNVNNLEEKSQDAEVKIPRGKMVLFIGDSLAEGMSAKFLEISRSSGYASTVDCLRGTRADYWSERIDSLIRSLRPDLVIISIGTNDAVMSVPENQRKHIKKIRSSIKNSGARLMWILPPSLPERLQGQNKIRQILKEEISEEETYDSSSLNLERTKDGVHLTTKGYRYWITNIWNKLTLNKIVFGPES